MRKRLMVVAIWVLIALLATAAMTGCSAGKPAEQKQQGQSEQAPSKKYSWKLSVTTAESSSWTRGAKKFADLVKERSNGNIVITVYPNEQLSGGNQPKGIEMVVSGATEMSIHSTMIWSVVEPRLAAVSLPFLFKNEAEVDRALNGKAGELLKQAVEAKGVKFLAWGENGFRQLTTGKKPVAKPADLKGLKIRVPAINILVSTFKQFGADPTVMNFSEVFTALQQGAIDGQENPLGVIDSSKLYEVQKYITMWNYCYDPLILSINKKLWDSLDSDTQKLLATAAKEAMDYQIKVNREENAAILKKLEEKGMKIITPSPDDLVAFQKACEAVYAEAEKTIGKDLIDMLKTKQ